MNVLLGYLVNYLHMQHIITRCQYIVRVYSMEVLQIWTISKQYNDDETLLAMQIGAIVFTVNWNLSTVGIHEYSILSAAFLCGYLYGDTLTMQ